MPLETGAIEEVYRVIADALDEVGPGKETLFLAKLALLLARECGDASLVGDAVRTAQRDLDET